MAENPRKVISLTYVVQKGDTMYLIAKRFGVALQDLIAANPQIKDPNLIYPGQVVNVPVAPAPPPAPHPTPPVSGWCTLCLYPLHPKCPPGSALVLPQDPHIMVALMGMPDPSAWTDCDVYTAWVMRETDDPVVFFWFDLLPAGRGFWINHHSPKNLGMSEVVLVTAENRGHGDSPGSMRMHKGSLRTCCRKDP